MSAVVGGWIVAGAAAAYRRTGRSPSMIMPQPPRKSAVTRKSSDSGPYDSQPDDAWQQAQAHQIEDEGGQSTFINILAQDDVVEVGSGGDSCTQDISATEIILECQETR